MIYMNICVNIIQLLKKNEILSSATGEMDFEDIMPRERSQTQKHKCCMISLICRADGSREVLVKDSFNHLSLLKMPLPRELGST